LYLTVLKVDPPVFFTSVIQPVPPWDHFPGLLSGKTSTQSPFFKAVVLISNTFFVWVRWLIGIEQFLDPVHSVQIGYAGVYY
jgi:hypothetical protein